MKPYVIASPDYDITSGGGKVMWGLYGYLLSKGVEVWMNRRPTGDVIAIYPEIQNGNPVETDRIVRYVLNTPGVMGSRDQYGQIVPGPTEFPGERVYYFSRLFGKTDEAHYLFLPIIDLHTMKVTNTGKRDKTCYLVGKGYNRNLHPTDAIELNRTVARDQKALADLLNQCKTLYIYDTLSAMMEVARLCGTDVCYLGDYPKEDLTQYEPGLNGITCGNETENPLNANAFREHYIGMVRLFQTKLDQFIEETQT